MIDFGKWAFANRKLVYFVVAVLLVGGILSAYDMSKLEDPEIKVKLAMVIATRPGASAHEMELEVTDPLEKNIRTMGEVESVTSSSFNDLAILEVELKSTVRDADVEQCWDMLRRKGFRRPAAIAVGNVGRRAGRLRTGLRMLYALTGDGLTERQLSDYAGLLKRELGDLDGVARVEIYGEREECIDISILPEKMAMLGVSPAEALATLNGQNNVYYAGYYDNGPDRIRVAVADKFRAVKEIESMVIQGHEDDQLRLCDIARVEHGLRRTRAQRDVLRGAACARHRRRSGFGQRHRQGRGRGGTLSGRVAGRALPCGSRLPQDFLPARAGQGCAGDVSDKPDRVGGDRRGHSDAYDGFASSGDHRHQLWW